MKQQTVIYNDTINKLLEFATERDIEFEVYEGNLNDNYIIYANNLIKVGRYKPRKYILIEESYLNTWQSENLMVMTDDYAEMKEFRERMTTYFKRI